MGTRQKSHKEKKKWLQRSGIPGTTEAVKKYLNKRNK